jgi:hypothetical protein
LSAFLYAVNFFAVREMSHNSTLPLWQTLCEQQQAEPKGGKTDLHDGWRDSASRVVVATCKGMSSLLVRMNGPAATWQEGTQSARDYRISPG